MKRILFAVFSLSFLALNATAGLVVPGPPPEMIRADFEFATCLPSSRGLVPDCSVSEGFRIPLVSEDFALRFKSLLISSSPGEKAHLLQAHISILRGGTYCSNFAKLLPSEEGSNSSFDGAELVAKCKSTLELYARGEGNLAISQAPESDISELNSLSTYDLQKSVSFLILFALVW